MSDQRRGVWRKYTLVAVGSDTIGVWGTIHRPHDVTSCLYNIPPRRWWDLQCFGGPVTRCYQALEPSVKKTNKIHHCLIEPSIWQFELRKLSLGDVTRRNMRSLCVGMVFNKCDSLLDTASDLGRTWIINEVDIYLAVAHIEWNVYRLKSWALFVSYAEVLSELLQERKYGLVAGSQHVECGCPHV